ncbi:GyrI-like domain-containing protein [Flammeovirgaceae bacterium SG7u.111]|nr:GyrI-like domain-containing protein [Flammeovirgaceae bacterium SG7u.132]WPO35017.1 GyrI-like domain-containing protein [Flammeovirgaceae bacterium SG7u.111]
MTPRIETLSPKKLVGKHLTMTLATNPIKTAELWRSFMPHRNEVKNQVGTDLISMQVYEEGLEYLSVTPTTEFEKWAATEVSEIEDLPAGMEVFELEGGKYAVFTHKGLPSDFPKTWKAIFVDWLPSSGFQLDHRPHFELLPAGYSPVDPNAEEEVWIPVR